MDSIAPSHSADAAPRGYLTELLWNQVWQSANFVSKALFLLILTPLMLKRWGGDGFGLFGLSSSLLVSMALTDGGVRSLTRLRLTEALRNSDESEFRRALGEGLFTFMAVLFFVILAATGLAACGWMRTILKLPAGGPLVLVATAVLTGASMTSLLALEPLAARGRLSAIKAANTWGAALAIPVCGLALWLNGSVLLVVFLYSVCMIVPNLILIIQAGILPLLPSWKEFAGSPRVVFGTLRSGIWYYATTIALVIKTHGLTFVVSALAGPAQAGIFYFMLRLTEILSSLGSTASETSLASLASTEIAGERRQKLNHCWQYVALFCLPGALVFAFQGGWLLRLWFPHQNLLWPAGLGMAVFGLAGAFSRMVVNASMGLQLVKAAAVSNLAEAALNVCGALIGYQSAGLPGVLAGGCAGVLMMLRPARGIAARCGESFFNAFVRPLSSLAAGMAIVAFTEAAAASTGSFTLKFAAVAVVGIITLIQLRRLHRRGPAGFVG